jgi:hypothetical protein
MILKTLPKNQLSTAPKELIEDLRGMIDQARGSIASTVNTRLTLLYWHLGNRIKKEILKDERAKYGKEIVAAVAQQLTQYYGKGFSEKSLRRMIQFGEAFPNEQIVAPLARQLTWTHFTVLLPLKESIKRDFYTEIFRIEKWNVRTLENKID